MLAELGKLWQSRLIQRLNSAVISFWHFDELWMSALLPRAENSTDWWSDLLAELYWVERWWAHMPLSVAGSMRHPVLEGYFGTIGLWSLGVLSFVNHSLGRPLVPPLPCGLCCSKAGAPGATLTLSLFGEIYFYFLFWDSFNTAIWSKGCMSNCSDTLVILIAIERSWWCV